MVLKQNGREEGGRGYEMELSTCWGAERPIKNGESVAEEEMASICSSLASY